MDALRFYFRYLFAGCFFHFQLDYKVGWKKLKEVFSMAGMVVRADILEDKDGKSRGMGTVTFDMPLEAVQAVCILYVECLNYFHRFWKCPCNVPLNYPSAMFNGQLLFNRVMHVKLVSVLAFMRLKVNLDSNTKSKIKKNVHLFCFAVGWEVDAQRLWTTWESTLSSA